MKRLVLTCMFALIVIGFAALTFTASGTKAATNSGQACENIITAKVNGLVCDFCAQALNKVFKKQDEVEEINVDLDNGVVKIVTKAGRDIEDETAKTLITDSGYDVANLKRGC